MKKKKEAQPMTLRMEKSLFDRLEAFCDDSGQTKTAAIERSLIMYLNYYEPRLKELKEEK